MEGKDSELSSRDDDEQTGCANDILQLQLLLRLGVTASPGVASLEICSRPQLLLLLLTVTLYKNGSVDMCVGVKVLHNWNNNNSSPSNYEAGDQRMSIQCAQLLQMNVEHSEGDTKRG